MHTGIDTLPEEVLATIFQVGSDEPSPALVYPPAVAVSHVSQRWRTIALDYPVLWATIRISSHLWSWHWAALSVQRSGGHPLDISINLECYEPKSCSLEDCQNPYDTNYPKPPRYLDVEKILAILGPHAARWRTIAIQGWYTQVLEILRSGHAAGARIESVHLAPLDGYYKLGDFQLQELTELVDTENLCALRISRKVFYGPVLSMSLKRASLSTLDVASQISEPCTRQLVDSMSSLTTLVLRDVYPNSFNKNIKSSTIQSFAICFSGEYSIDWSNVSLYQFLTETFLFPNLERLEIFGDAKRLAHGHSQLHLNLPAEWETAAFPHLHTLRLEDLELNPTVLAHVQALSQGITDFTLVNVLGTNCLLAPDVVGAWCDLKTLTVEWLNDNSRTRQNPARSWSRLPHTDSAWLAAFVKIRAELGMQLTYLVLSQEVARSLRLAIRGPGWPPIRTLDTPSPALIDGGTQPGRRFYTNSVDQYDLDFEPVSPASQWWCVCGCYLGACGSRGSWDPRYNVFHDHEQEFSRQEEIECQEDEIEVYEKMAAEILRTKDILQKSRKEKRRGCKRVRTLKRSGRPA